MTRSLVASLALLVVVTGHATITEALVGACFTGPLPDQPIAPVFAMEIEETNNHAQLDLWRQPCTDGSGQVAALIKLTPLHPAALVCGSLFSIIQGGATIGARFQAPGLFDYCSFLGATTPTVLLRQLNDPVVFNAAQPFTLRWNRPSLGTPLPPVLLQVPAYEGPVTAPPPPPTILVVGTGCTTCHSGQTAAYEARITNPGSAFLAEIKGGARVPDGTILPLLHQVTTVPSGPSVIIIAPAQVLPLGLPTIDLLVEAAILEPALGVTLARHNVTLHVLP